MIRHRGRPSRLDGALRRLAHAGTGRPGASLTVLAVVATASLLALPGLEIAGNTARLVPSDDREGAAYRRSEELFGESNPLVLRLRGGGSRQDLLRVARAVRDDVAAWPDVVTAYVLPHHEIPDLAARLRAAVGNGEVGTRADLLRRLEPQGMRRQLLRTRKRLLSAGDPALREAIASDPLAVRELLEGYYTPRGLASFVGGAPTSTPGGATDPLVLLYPAGSAEDGVYCQRLLGRIEAAVEAARRQVAPDEAIGVDAAGIHALTAQTRALFAGDMVRITALALVLLTGFLALTFGDVRTLVVVMVPLVLAQLLLLAAACWLFNPIHFLTVGSVAVVLGMGIDGSIHLVARYREMLAELPWRRAVEEALVECVPPLIVGTMSTVALFLALALSRSPGLVEMGLLTGIGLVASLVCTVAFFPALVATMRSRDGSGGERRLRWVARGLPVLAARHPGRAALLGALLLASGAAAGLGLELDLGVESLVPHDLPALETAKQLRTGRELALDPPLLVRVTAPSLERALEAQHRVDRSLEEIVASGAASRFSSPSELLATASGPGSSSGGESRSAPDRGEIERSFVRIATELGLRSDPGWPGYLSNLARAASSPAEEGLPAGGPPALARYLAREGGGTVHLQTYVTPGARPGSETAPGAWMDVGSSRRLVSMLGELDVGEGAELTVTGLLPVYLRVNELVRSDVARVGVAGGLLIVGMLLLFFRDWRFTVAGLLPVAAGVPVTVGVLVASDVTVTPITLCFGAVVLGIGIDDAVHVLWRLRGRPERTLASVMAEVGPLLMLTTVSSAIGFGSLAVSRVPVVASMGLAVAVGVVACWVFTLLLLPLASRAVCSRAGRAAAALVGLVLLTGTTLRAAPPPADSILAELERRAAEVEALEASFRLVRSVPELTAPVVLDGWLHFQRPLAVEVRLRGAENLDLLSDGEWLWWVDRDLEEVERLALGGEGHVRSLGRRMPLLLFLSADLPRDEVRTTSEQPERAHYRLRVEPREPSEWGFDRIVLELDRRYRLVWMRAEDGAGAWSEYSFGDWRRAEPRGEETFRGPSPLPEDR